MAGRRKKIAYDEELDLFIAPTWPDAFLQDPAYALFRPLYEYTSPWRASHSTLCHYLNGQARRLGGRQYILFHFLNLAKISKSYESLHAFLLDPFTNKHKLLKVFVDLEAFLRWRFEFFTNDPWSDLQEQEDAAAAAVHVSEKDLATVPIALSETDKKKILKKELSKIPWQQQLQRSLEYESGVEGFHAALIENAIKECPELLQQNANQDLVQQIFSSPMPSLSLTLNEAGYTIAEIPVMLGSHYLGKKAQKVWFDGRGRKFHRILGCYARWDDAKVVVFKHTVHDDTVLQKQMFSAIKDTHALNSVGTWKKAQVDGLDYYLSLLIDSDLPDRTFFVSEWEVNCPHLLIKDTGVCQ